MLITLSVYRSRRKPISVETTSLRLFLKGSGEGRGTGGEGGRGRSGMCHSVRAESYELWLEIKKWQVTNLSVFFLLIIARSKKHYINFK